MSQPAEEPRGARCPDCWSTFVPVTHTERLFKGTVRRRRECQHCGRRFVTTERTGPPPKKG